MAMAIDLVRPPLAYDDTGGEGPPLVLIHGVGLSRTMWAAQVPALAARFRVIAVDMPGHGQSPAPSAEAGLAAYADRVVAVLDYLDVDKAIIVGFSMGALVARAMALHHRDRVSALVLLNGVFDRSPDVSATILARVDDVLVKGPGANIDGAIDRWFSPEFRRTNQSYLGDLRKHFVANDPESYAITYRLFATEDRYGEAELGAIDVPTLVATGEFDIGSTPAMTEALAARIPGAIWRIVPDARHMMPVEKPDAINTLLLEFLTSVEQGGSFGDRG